MSLTVAEAREAALTALCGAAVTAAPYTKDDHERGIAIPASFRAHLLDDNETHAHVLAGRTDIDELAAEYLAERAWGGAL